MTERMNSEYQHTSTPERTPTYDSFGDHDEALAWIADRAVSAFGTEQMVVWWVTPTVELEDRSPSQVWTNEPDEVIRLVSNLA